MTSAKDVYTAFSSFKARQEDVLKSINIEKQQVVRDLETVSQDLIQTLATLFPTADDLPLALFSEAAAKTGTSRDFTRLRQALENADEENRQQYRELIDKHGTSENLQIRSDAAVICLTRLQGEISDHSGAKGRAETELGTVTARLKPLDQHAEKFGVKLTNANRAAYETFSLKKWAISPEWRAGRKAIEDYRAKIGIDIDADYRERGSLQAASEELKGKLDDANTKKMEEEKNQKYFQDVLSRMRGLDEGFQGPEKIHRSLCANIVDLLVEEAFSDAVCAGMPKEKADKLMLETLKIRNLHVLFNNLEGIRIQTEKALGKVSDPAGKLKKLASRSPSHKIDIDLDDIGKKLEAHATAASGYVARSSQTRSGLQNFSSAYQRSDTSGTDTSFMLMQQQFLMFMLLTSGSPASADSSFNNAASPVIDPAGAAPDLKIDFGNAQDVSSLNLPDVSVPDLSSVSQALDSVSIPSIPESSGGYSGGYDGGGGFSGGGDCGGGSFISASIADDPAMRRHMRFMPR